MGDTLVLGQFVRYALVGLASNALLYVSYLALTWAGLGPKVSMTLVYALGVACTFIFNKRWSFQHGGLHGPAFARYCAAYGLGYVANLALLYLLADVMGFAHEWVQGVLILVISLMLFALQKFWVFRAETGGATA